MIHYGDITKIDGYSVPIADCVIGGSPCQDLSQAGLRQGIRHGELGDDTPTRSGLFMEQLRIFKEMREHDRRLHPDNDVRRPRFLVWENVQGAFSSSNGEDFRCVLEEICKIQGEYTIPKPKKWENSGVIVGEGFSIAWRLMDAQFYGVPQRRKRICLVADFGGEHAETFLALKGGMSRDTAEGKRERQDTAPDTQGSAGEPVAIENRANDSRCKICADGKVQSLTSRMGTGGNNVPMVMYGISPYDSNAMKSSNPDSGCYIADTTRTLDRRGGNPDCNQGGMAIVTLETYHCTTDTKAQTLKARDYKDPQCVALDCYNQTVGAVAKSLTNAASDSDHVPCVADKLTVRRLTPRECERLQGLPDDWTLIGERRGDDYYWTDSTGKKRKCVDSARYKALGNGIATPPVEVCPEKNFGRVRNSADYG